MRVVPTCMKCAPIELNCRIFPWRRSFHSSACRVGPPVSLELCFPLAGQGIRASYQYRQPTGAQYQDLYLLGPGYKSRTRSSIAKRWIGEALQPPINLGAVEP